MAHTGDQLCSHMAKLNTLNAGLDLLLPLVTVLWPPVAADLVYPNHAHA
jgi:hypothetical protein